MSWKPTLDQSGKPIFPIASEAAYLKQPCEAVSRAVVAECTRRGVSFRSEAFQPTSHAENQVISSKRGHKAVPPLVAEYLYITDVQPEDCNFKAVDRIPFEVKKGDADISSLFMQPSRVNIHLIMHFHYQISCCWLWLLW